MQELTVYHAFRAKSTANDRDLLKEMGFSDEEVAEIEASHTGGAPPDEYDDEYFHQKFLTSAAKRTQNGEAVGGRPARYHRFCSCLYAGKTRQAAIAESAHYFVQSKVGGNGGDADYRVAHFRVLVEPTDIESYVDGPELLAEKYLLTDKVEKIAEQNGNGLLCVPNVRATDNRNCLIYDYSEIEFCGSSDSIVLSYDKTLDACILEDGVEAERVYLSGQSVRIYPASK